MICFKRPKATPRMRPNPDVVSARAVRDRRCWRAGGHWVAVARVCAGLWFRSPVAVLVTGTGLSSNPPLQRTAAPVFRPRRVKSCWGRGR